MRSIIVARVTAVERSARCGGRRTWTGRGSTPTPARLPGPQPGDRRVVADVPRMGAAETRRALAAAERALPAWRARTAKDRARDPAPARRPDARARGRPRAAHGHRAGQAARRGARRGRVRRLVLRVVRRGGEAGLRRHDPDARGPTSASSSRRSRSASPPGITPWNFPAAMLTRKSAPGARGRLHDGAEAGRADAALARSRSPRSPRRRACPAGVLLGRHRRRRGRARDRRRDDLEPGRAQARLHRLDGGREAADGAVRAHGSRRSRSSSAATRRSSSSTTPTSTRRSRARSLCKFRNSGQTCISREPDARAGRRSTTSSSRASRPRSAALEGRATASTTGVNVGPLIDEPAVEKVERHVADARRPRAPSSSSAARRHRGASSSSRPCSTGVDRRRWR